VADPFQGAKESLELDRTISRLQIRAGRDCRGCDEIEMLAATTRRGTESFTKTVELSLVFDHVRCELLWSVICVTGTYLNRSVSIGKAAKATGVENVEFSRLSRITEGVVAPEWTTQFRFISHFTWSILIGKIVRAVSENDFGRKSGIECCFQSFQFLSFVFCDPHNWDSPCRISMH
jgi:hypothetical protein